MRTSEDAPEQKRDVGFSGKSHSSAANPPPPPSGQAFSSTWLYCQQKLFVHLGGVCGFRRTFPSVRCLFTKPVLMKAPEDDSSAESVPNRCCHVSLFTSWFCCRWQLPHLPHLPHNASSSSSHSQPCVCGSLLHSFSVFFLKSVRFSLPQTGRFTAVLLIWQKSGRTRGGLAGRIGPETGTPPRTMGETKD